MKISYVKIVFVLMASALLALSCGQSETTAIMVGKGTGGTTATGGGTATGGSSATGGNTATGGMTATGGSGTGGISATGGTTGTGGTSATGGTTGTGGVPATGGITGSGGAAGKSGTAGTNGAAGKSGAGGAAASFADVTALFAANCVACHDGSNHTDLRASGLYNRIVNQNATKSCATLKLIVPGSPSTSLISNKIHGGAALGSMCGVRMPYMCSATSSNPRACLTAAQIATVDNWISAGAPM